MSRLPAIRKRLAQLEGKRQQAVEERDSLSFEAYVSAAEHELRRLGEAWTSLPAANDLLAFLREVLQRMIHKQKSKQPAISRWASSVLREKASKLKGLYDDANKNIEVTFLNHEISFLKSL